MKQGILIGALAIVVAVVILVVRGNTSAPPDTQRSGLLGSTLTLPDHSLSIQVDHVEKGNGYLLLHFHAHNQASTKQQIQSDAAHRRFILVLQTPAGAPASDSEVVFTTPEAALLSTHPLAQNDVTGLQDADGWVEAQFSSQYTPYYVAYQYDVANATKCKDPKDSSTCQATTLPKVITWTFN